jgi:hypothetical protein
MPGIAFVPTSSGWHRISSSIQQDLERDSVSYLISAESDEANGIQLGLDRDNKLLYLVGKRSRRRSRLFPRFSRWFAFPFPSHHNYATYFPIHFWGRCIAVCSHLLQVFHTLGGLSLAGRALPALPKNRQTSQHTRPITWSQASHLRTN